MSRTLLTVVLSAALAGAAPNLLPNPGAEDGAEPWSGTAQRSATGGRGDSACWTGTITKPAEHRQLNLTLELRAETLYDLSLWARTDRRCQVVLWLAREGQRINKGRWEQVPAEWTRLETRFSVPSDGTWELQLIFPSSHGEQPTGTAWIDDLSLVEAVAGRFRPLSAEGELADQVTCATAPDGSLWAAWESFETDRDRLTVARLAAGEVAVEQSWPVDLAGGRFTLWPRLVGGPAGVWLLAAVERDRQWDILVWPVTATGPGRPLTVSTGPANDVRVAGDASGDSLWLAWQSNRDGQRRIWAAEVRDGRVGEPVPVAADGSYNPAVAVGGGRVHVLYDRFVEANRDIWLSTLAEGQWLPPRRLTTSNRHDLAPVAVWWRDGLWLAWEFGTHNGYRICSLDRKSVQVARVTDAGLAAPVGLTAGVPGEFVEQPTLLVDAGDRLHLAVRQATGDRGRGGWTTRLATYTGARWSDWRELTVRTGRARRAALASAGDGLLVCGQSDNVGAGYASLAAAAEMWTRVEGLRLPAAGPPAEELATVPLVERDDERFTLQADWAQMSEGLPRFGVELAGRRLTGYFGNFHEHSDISVCARAQDSRTEEDYVWMREIARLDFGAVTDHCYNQAAPIWRYSAKITRASYDPDRFVAFVGEEWTSNQEKTTKPPGYYGHRNLIFADPYFPRWLNSRDERQKTPQQVWDELAGENYIMIPHQLADAGTNVPIDWNYTHEVNQPVAEIFQARDSYEADDAPRRTKAGYPGYFLQDVWRRGIKIGVIASPDHGGGKGKAGVLVDTLTRESILDACRARHTWGTSGAKIALAVSVADRLMGDAIQRDRVAPVKVQVSVSAGQPVAAIRVIRNNAIVYSHGEPGPQVTFDWLDNAPLEENAYYYVRVERADGELAWSSPVWLDKAAP